MLPSYPFVEEVISLNEGVVLRLTPVLLCDVSQTYNSITDAFNAHKPECPIRFESNRDSVTEIIYVGFYTMALSPLQMAVSSIH